MTTYATSESTRANLIMAAGELFAEYGIDAVTTRGIAEKAGENIGIIHYHFGGKEGLIEAVVEFACELWKDNPLGTYFESHRDLLKNREGQSILITELIRIFLSRVFSSAKPYWCGTLVFQLTQRDLDISKKTFNYAAVPNIAVFMEVYRFASGDTDRERAYHWSMSIIAPAVLIAVNPHAFPRIFGGCSPSGDFMAKLEALCVHNALSSIDFFSQVK